MEKADPATSNDVLSSEITLEAHVPFVVAPDVSRDELVTMVHEYEKISREYLLELMQQRDEIIGLRNESANLAYNLNVLDLELKKKTIEYDRIKSRLRRFDRMTESFPFRVLRKLYRLPSSLKSQKG